jgi:NADH-quinone oxidoreductase subunit N
MSYGQLFQLVIPETIVVVTALAVLGLDLACRRKPLSTRLNLAFAVTVLGSILAIGWLLATLPQAKDILANGALVMAPLSQYIKEVVLLLTILTACISIRQRFTTHVGEYFAMMLLAAVGMMFLVSSENILMIFIALELLSLSL